MSVDYKIPSLTYNSPTIGFTKAKVNLFRGKALKNN